MTSTFWDHYAAVGYDALRVLAPYEALQQAMLDAVRPAPDERMLVAGCGTGNLEWLAARRMPGMPIDAVDFSPAMLARARAKCAALPTVRHLQADLCAEMPLPTAHYDVAVMCNVLYALPAQRTALLNIRRLLRPGGRLILCDRHPWSTISPVVSAHLATLRHLPPSARARRWAHTLAAVPRFALVTLANLAIQRRGQEGTYHFFALQEISDLLRAIDFTVGECRTVYAEQCWLLHATRDETEHARPI